jgi:hypothetical protein
MYKKRQEFEDAVSQEARKITFPDITKELDSASPHYQGKFKHGQTISFLICQGHYQVSIKPDELILQGSHDILIARFVGEEVENYYKKISQTLLQEQEPSF